MFGDCTNPTRVRTFPEVEKLIDDLNREIESTELERNTGLFENTREFTNRKEITGML
jgi:hypothetical protein